MAANNLPKPLPCESVAVQLEPTDGTLPASLGIEVPGGRVERVLEQGIRLPHRHTALYSTADSYQMAAEFHIVMGERVLARDNLDVARVRVRNVKWGGAGQPKIEIVFDISEDGCLTITTANKDKKDTEMLAFVALPTVSAAMVQQAQADAEAHGDEDAAHERNIETMLSGYQLMDEAYERFALAKRRMNFVQKHAYKAARKRLARALNVMPPEATDATMAELNGALEAFRTTYDAMERDYRAVKSWWGKQ